MARTDIPRELLERARSIGPSAVEALEASYPTEEQARADREAEEQRVQARRRAQLRELARVGVEALNGEHGAQAQIDATTAFTKDGDLRPEVEALARWWVACRDHQKLPPLELQMVRRALESGVVERALRTMAALLRESRASLPGKGRRA